MNIARHFLLRLSVSILALTLSTGVQAVGIGNAILLSHLGEPLHVAVPLHTDHGEKLADDCLSLLPADANEAGSAPYLSAAQLTLKDENGWLYADIRSRKSLDEPFASFRLRVGCPGKGSVTRTLTILPDLDTAPPQPAAAATVPSPPAALPVVTASRIAPPPPPSKPHILHKHRPAPQRAAPRAEQTDRAFVFKLSLNLSDTAPRDRMAGQAQNNARSPQQGEAMQLRLESVAELPPPAAAAPEPVAAQPAATPIATEELVKELDNRSLQRMLAIAGLLLSLTIPLLGYRYFSRRHKQRPASRPKPALHIASGHDHDKQAGTEHSTLEEAELYAIHGHPDKAIALLQETVRQQPAYEEAWLLLFSIYSAHGRKRGFANSAHTFHQQHPGSKAWQMIQALGRTLEPDNPLYAGSSRLGAAAPFLPHIALSKRRPIGSILVDMGLLTEQDVEIYLADFDPVRHGRFGNYLVSRRQISHAQLNEALFKQQQEEASIPNLPTLQDMENFLADFDPKRDGSIGEFLLARKAITPAQLNKVQPQKTPADDASQPLDFHTPAAKPNSGKPDQ